RFSRGASLRLGSSAFAGEVRERSIQDLREQGLFSVTLAPMMRLDYFGVGDELSLSWRKFDGQVVRNRHADDALERVQLRVIGERQFDLLESGLAALRQLAQQLPARGVFLFAERQRLARVSDEQHPIRRRRILSQPAQMTCRGSGAGGGHERQADAA